MKGIGIIGFLVLFCTCKTKSTRGQLLQMIYDTEMTLAHALPDTAGNALVTWAAKMQGGAGAAEAQYAEAEFIRALLRALQQPGSFETDFAVLTSYDIHILNAEDGRLRIIYWLSPYSGSMWHVQHIIQYKENNGLVALKLNDLYEQPEDEAAPTPFFEHIYALEAPAQNSYLLTGYGQMSGMEPYAVAHTLVWENGRFTMNKKLFKEGPAWRSALFAQADLRDDTQADQTRKRLKVTYDPKTKILTYPEAKAGEDGFIFTGNLHQLVYRDGKFQ